MGPYADMAMRAIAAFVFFFTPPAPTAAVIPAITPIPTDTPIPTPQPTVQPTVAVARTAPSPINPEELWTTLNLWRIDHGKPAFVESSPACAIADIRIGDIQKNFSHTGLKTRAAAFPEVKAVTENIVVHNSTSLAANSWINSTPHRNNLLTHLPFTCLRIQGRYAVQVFTDH